VFSAVEEGDITTIDVFINKYGVNNIRNPELVSCVVCLNDKELCLL